jgi:hypothetical protein
MFLSKVRALEVLHSNVGSRPNPQALDKTGKAYQGQNTPAYYEKQNYKENNLSVTGFHLSNKPRYLISSSKNFFITVIGKKKEFSARERHHCLVKFVSHPCL